jgi:hypothetical protein
MTSIFDPRWALDQAFPDPSRDAGKYLDKIPGQTNKYNEPFFNAGAGQLPQLQDIYQRLLSNPDEIMKMLGQGYQQSPGYQWNLKQGTEAINNANAAGGMLGTPQHEQMAAEMATGLASQDYQKFMDHIMQLFSGGVTGSQTMANQGQAAGNDMANRIAEYLKNQATLKYTGQQSRNDMTGSLLGGALKFAGL